MVVGGQLFYLGQLVPHGKIKTNQEVHHILRHIGRRRHQRKLPNIIASLKQKRQLTKMGSMEKFCLRWNDFGGNVFRSFASIREDKQFFDCTLTTDDDDDDTYSENLRAHKVILSASSDFFRKILTKKSLSENSNPVLYLRGISTRDLKHILDFIYHGEVNVAKDELDKFLEVAETLKIHGLTSSVRGCKRPAKSPSPSHKSPKCATKREPEEPEQESFPSLVSFENIVGQDEDSKEDFFTNHEDVNDEDDRDRGSEDFETTG